MVHFALDKSLEIKVENVHMNENSGNKRKPKNGLCLTKFVEFCKRTDFHGFKYVVMEDLNIFERSFWTLAVLVSTTLAVNFVIIAYKWYARNPIVTVIESTQGAIWDIPFPAVTICDLNIVSRKAARALANNLTLVGENMTADEVFETFRLVPLLHTTFYVETEQKQALRRLQAILELNHISIENLYRILSPASSCNQLVQRCMWKNAVYRCEVLFQPVFTHFSLCCTFNYYAVERSGKDRPPGERFTNDWPRRVASCGYQTALSVLVSTNSDDYFSASVASQGALVFIGNAYDIPNVDSPVRMVSPSTEVMIALSPERTYTTAGIKAFAPRDRQCFFSDEVKVGNFMQYTFHNCLAFQRIEEMRNVCDCVPYFFPLKDYYRICNFNDIDCLETILVQKDVHPEQSYSFHCLPECEHYGYPLEVALGKLAVNAKLHGLPFFNGISLENSSLVNVFFNDLVSTRYRRDVYLNWQNLLGLYFFLHEASFGGLLSLMLGFTLIAGVDLVIFFTFNVACSSVTPAKEEHNLKKINRKGNKNTKIYYVQELHKHHHQ